MSWQITFANMLFSVTSIVLWIRGDSATTSTGREVLRGHLSWRDSLFKVLHLVHQEGGNAAQTNLDMRLLFSFL